ncbi:MAG: (2Fe-2S)-binding protein, partial [Epsilonproteobacteria bacterium]
MITAQRIDHLFICPKCANEGNKVKIITPQTLLKEGALERLKNKLAYKFCQKPDCDVVYFSKESGHVFLTSGLKLPATVKDPG